MKHTMTSASRWLLVIAALVAALTSTSRAANYSQGDELTLTRDEPLLFREQVFRQGKAGEKLTVLAHRPDRKMVYVSGTDKAGKQIALSVPEEAVTPIQVDIEKPPSGTVGPLTTKSGLVFRDWKISRIEGEIVVLSHADGVTRISKSDLPPEIIKGDVRLETTLPSNAEAMVGINGQAKVASPSVVTPPTPSANNASREMSQEEQKAAFEKYRFVFIAMNKKAQLKGEPSVSDVANITMIARVQAQQARETQNELLANEAHNVEALAYHGSDFAGSGTGRQLQGLQAALGSMTNSQLLAIKMQDGSTALDFRNGGMRAMMERGNPEEMHKMLAFARSGGFGANFSIEGWQQVSAYLTDQDVREASEGADFKTAGVKVAARNMNTRVAKMLEERITPASLGIVRKIGGMDKFLERIELRDIGDPKKVAAALSVMGVDPQQAGFENTVGDLTQHGAAIRAMMRGSQQGRLTFGDAIYQDAVWNAYLVDGAKAKR